MPISITKNDPPLSATLYCIQLIGYINGAQVVSRGIIYESVDHYRADFLPIIQKIRSITDPATVAQIYAQYGVNYDAAIRTIEEYLISSDPWYQGGSILAPGQGGVQRVED